VLACLIEVLKDPRMRARHRAWDSQLRGGAFSGMGSSLTLRLQTDAAGPKPRKARGGSVLEAAALEAAARTVVVSWLRSLPKWMAATAGAGPPSRQRLSASQPERSCQACPWAVPSEDSLIRTTSGANDRGHWGSLALRSPSGGYRGRTCQDAPLVACRAGQDCQQLGSRFAD
jgi:hypothetical protein